MTDPTAVPCNAAQLHRFGDLSSEHGPHEWIVQPGMPAVRCPGTAASSAGQAPATDQTALRDRIADALIRWTYRGQDPDPDTGILDTVRANAYSRADAVLAVLPAPVDQAEAVLREVETALGDTLVASARGEALAGIAGVLHATPAAVDQAATRTELDSLGREADRLRKAWVEMCARAERVEAEVERLRADRSAILREAAQRLYTALFPAVYADMGQKAAEGVNRAVSELRRMADETPATEPEPEACAHCGQPISRITGTLAAWWVHDPGGNTVCDWARAAASTRATPKPDDEAAARNRAAVLSAEVTRRAPLLGEYAAQIASLRTMCEVGIARENDLIEERDQLREARADRAAVLREAAEALDNSERLRDFTDDHMSDINEAANELRRMADETQPEGEPACAHCGGDHSWGNCEAYTVLVVADETPAAEESTADTAARLGMTPEEYRAHRHLAAVRQIRAALPGLYAMTGLRVEAALKEPAAGARQDEPAVPVHAIPLPGSNGISACCGRPPCEFVGEHVTRDPDKVTCTRAAAGARQDGAQS